MFINGRCYGIKCLPNGSPNGAKKKTVIAVIRVLRDLQGASSVERVGAQKSGNPPSKQ